ncbi:unnamed protein product [Prorocentrum cordatum]|uniref:Anaphase-promoting complex subunit 1 n=1 Tax=Prorocentrum cordatum TaxID=2364126 RepID=A0ABN9UNG5_9DINO|nr:unnamed protein product [Polarella glacialis]
MRPSAFPRSPCGPPTIYVCMPSFVPRLAPRLQLGRGPRAQLAPERTLVAGLFAHGEVGLDAVASRAPPEAAAGALLRELATYKRLRWLDAGAGGAAAADGAELKAPRPRAPGWVARPARRGVLARHPLVAELLADGAGGGAGRCLQHSNFGHLELAGESLGELQASLARNSAARAYWPPAGEALLAGCALRSREGLLYAGPRGTASSSGDAHG